MKAHIKEMHEERRKYKCEVCEYAAFTTGHLQKHKKLTHGLDTDNDGHSWEQCSYKAANKIHLKAHKRRKHEKLKNNACDECGYACKSKSALEKHKEFVHVLGFPVFNCDHCSYETYLKENFRKHVESMRHIPLSSTK